MRRSNFELPRHPAGAVFIHDDAVWVAGEKDSFRTAFIRREDDATWSIIVQPDPLSVQRRLHNGPLVTTARAALKRYAGKLRDQSR